MENTEQNGHIITKREIALGALSKPVFRGTDECERYMNHGDVVSFLLSKQNSDFNAEFTLNGDAKRKIWLSQLNRVYLAAEGRELYTGLIRFKNGNTDCLAVYQCVNDFLEVTKGKQFRVSVTDDLYAIDKWADKCVQLGTYTAIRDYICDALDGQRYNDVVGMTKSMVCYSLTEV